MFFFFFSFRFTSINTFLILPVWLGCVNPMRYSISPELFCIYKIWKKMKVCFSCLLFNGFFVDTGNVGLAVFVEVVADKRTGNFSLVER